MSEVGKQDEIINVNLSRRDYETLREIIETRQALSGAKKIISSTILWVAGGLITILGLVEILKRY